MLNIARGAQEIMAGITLGNFDPDQCKIRVIPYQNFIVGLKKTDENFIHISIKILSGRALQIRQELAQKVIDFAIKNYQQLGYENKRCDISVDIIEMDKETYKKATLE